MADELTSTEVAPEASPVKGQAQPASQTEPRPTTPESVPQTREEQPVNLQDIPDFRNYQRQANEREATKDKKHQQEMAQMRAEVDALATRDMSDDELRQHTEKKMQQAMAEKDEAYNSLYQAYAGDLAKSEIARKTGVDPSVIASADNPDEAWELALKERVAAVEAKAEAKYKNAIASSPGNTPDLGAAAPAVPRDALSTVPAFKSSKEMAAYYRDRQDEMNS